MPRGRRKRVIVESDSENDSCDLATRRSSLRVNLSFTSNLSPSGDGSLRKIAAERDETLKEPNEVLFRTVEKRNIKNVISDETATPASVANVTVINAADSRVNKNKSSNGVNTSILVMKEKEQQLDRRCVELKDAIINKTQALFDNELSRKTSEILLTGHSSARMLDTQNCERSPSIRINIGKNDQIIMTGCGEKQNPVRINSMSKKFPSDQNLNKASQNSEQDSSDCSQSIASTPKKPNTKTSVDKLTGRTSTQIIKIPVARLFIDGDPNNSMSQINPLPSTRNLHTSISKDHEVNKINNISRLSNELNTTVSPILSQGTRKNRISRLSLKRKLTGDGTRNSRVSSSTINESFINRSPLICSSFIEKPEKICNKNNFDQHTKTIILEEKSETIDSSKTVLLDENSETIDNLKTVNLDDNENNTNTINIDHSSSRSSMEITTISARTPIIRKSFQNIIRKSINFDNVDIPGNKINKLCSPNQQSINLPNQNKSVITNKSNISSSVTNSKNKNVYQNDCNTVKTSLNDDTLDDISLAARVILAEKKRPTSLKKVLDEISKINPEEESQRLTTMRSSLRVNTSLDSVRKSSDDSKANSEEERNKSAQVQSIYSKSNQEKEESAETKSCQTTNRSSMQVNTSLDSVKKSSNIQKPLNYNKILSIVEEVSFSNNLEVFNLQCQSSDNDSETDNIPLLERIQNSTVSKNKKSFNEQDSSEERLLEISKIGNEHEMPLCRVTKKIRETEKNDLEKIKKSKELDRPRKSNDAENIDSIKRTSKISEPNTSNIKRKSSEKSSKKSTDNKNLSSNGSESSIVEATPYPASRSLLFKTIIKNNIAMNTLDPRKIVDSSDDEENAESLSNKTISSPKQFRSIYARKNTLSQDSLDTVIINSSDESSNESIKKTEKAVIDESLNNTVGQNKSKINKSSKSKRKRKSKNSSDDEEQNKKINKRKLYPLRENSQISFSPAEIKETPREIAPKEIKRKKKRKMTRRKQENVEVRNSEVAEESDHVENEVYTYRPEKKKKKPRKIKSKKIVVKKVTNLTLLDNILEHDKEIRFSKDRSSLKEFDLRKTRIDTRKDNNSKNHKMVIVVTGHDKDDKDLVKNVVKTLGFAVLQANVTPRTTHVISSGVRTINLLKGIIRGCWLLTLEWALKSLESGKWLDPLPYEMSHFAKAVQENRRDRKLFGKGYVPDLFITCGPMYIENGTTPPASTLKELVKTAGGRITEDTNRAKIVIGLEGLKENWILDSITTGELQPFNQYKRN